MKQNNNEKADYFAQQDRMADDLWKVMQRSVKESKK